MQLQTRYAGSVMWDNDGVMSGWFPNFYPWLCRVEGWEEIPDCAHGETGWHFYRHHEMTDEAFVARLHEYAANGGFAEQIPDPELPEATRLLHEHGLTQHVVTDRPAIAEADTAWWLDVHAPLIDTLTVSRDKTEFMKFGPAPYFAIDDRVENVAKLTDAGVRAFLRDRPWNQHGNFPRVGGLIEFAHTVIESI